MTARNVPVQTHIAWHPGRYATRCPPAPAGGFLCRSRVSQEAPGGNPGTPGVKTTPPSMPDDGTQLPGSNPHRMAPGKVCDPLSPGFVGALGPEGRVVCTRAAARQANCGTRPQVRVQHPPRLPPGAFCAVRACQAERTTRERAPAKLAPPASRNGTAKPDRPETQHQLQEADWLNYGARCASYAHYC
jgi:hypothetical protein